MTNPYRAMCAELIDALDSGIPAARIRMSPLADRARALLAEAVAEGPSELELEAIELALWDKYRTKGWGGEEFMYDNNFSYALEEYRAVLARWGRPAAARAVLPPSLKERALQAWAAVEAGTDDQAAMSVIRRALEALPE